MSTLHELAQRLMSLDDKITACMKCGMCQAVCPMFGASGMEADVAAASWPSLTIWPTRCSRTLPP